MTTPAGTTRGRCTSCNARILWAVTATSGRPIPLDPEPRADGNIELRARGDEIRAVVLGRDAAVQGDLLGGAPRYVSHFVTCVNASSHRKPRSAP